MAYNNYAPPPGAYGGHQPSYGAPAGANPAMGLPPNFAAPPGMEVPPGMAAQSPGGMQAPFQPPSNFGNINFNAPVIRLGVDGQRQNQPSSDRMGGERGGREGRGSNAEPLGNRGRLGLGAEQGSRRDLDRERQQVRENMLALQPPTREEVARTIFIGGLGEHLPHDEALENILRCAGKLRRWTRARDSDDKKCKFGFAEYEDVESLEAAAHIFPEIQVPLFNADGSVQREDGDAEAEDRPVKKAQLLVVVDEQSKDYIEQWKGRKKEEESARQFRIDSCKEELGQVIAGLVNQAAHATNGIKGQSNGDADGDVAMGEANGEKGDGAEVVTIPLSLEDELADIPAEMRATVAEEIKAFRDRSTRRDIERLRREEELEQEERRRSGAPARINRLATPPPSGPASAANGIPVGPRGQQGVQGAPSGPKGFRGAQIPSDYANGVAFIPGAGPNGSVVSVNREDEDAEESDEELERRRKEKKDAELEKQYNEQIRRWQNRERTRGAAQERERKREADERRQIEKARDDMMKKFAAWNDDEEAERAKHKYYGDRSAWARNREYEREKERREDDMDRKAEEHENADERRRESEARGMADDFLGSMEIEQESRPAEQPAGFGGFKISLGGAAARNRQAQAVPASKRAMADVEGLLEDEEDAAASGLKRPELKPLQDTSTVPTSGQDLTDEEKAAARQQLASEIPTEAEALFELPIKWDSISTAILDTQIRPFVERKVVEYLGVQEDLIVDAVLDGVQNRSKPRDLVEELLGPLEDEAEVLVRKVWRLLVFWGECESRSLGG